MHAGAVITIKRLRHESYGFIIADSYILDDILEPLQIISHIHEGVETHIDLGLAASGNFGQVLRKNYPACIGNRVVGDTLLILFGPWYGFAYAWLGQILGMTVLFVVARSGFRALARRLVHQHVEAARRIDAHLEDRGVSVVAALRLFYFMGTPLSIMLSTTRLRLRHFVAGTAIGVVPAVALAVASADAVASGATAVTAAVIGVSLVLVVGLGTVVRRRFGI